MTLWYCTSAFSEGVPHETTCRKIEFAFTRDTLYARQAYVRSFVVLYASKRQQPMCDFFSFGCKLSTMTKTTTTAHQFCCVGEKKQMGFAKSQLTRRLISLTHTVKKSKQPLKTERKSSQKKAASKYSTLY